MEGTTLAEKSRGRALARGLERQEGWLTKLQALIARRTHSLSGPGSQRRQGICLVLEKAAGGDNKGGMVETMVDHPSNGKIAALLLGFVAAFRGDCQTQDARC